MSVEFTKVAKIGDLNEGGMVPVTAGGEDVLLARVGGEYFAIGNRCTHFEACLTDGYLLTDTCEVQCPLHDSRFSLRSGVPNEPPAEDPVLTYAVRIVGDDILVAPNEAA
jgi:nitrite reductase/ring-hydroxylating ferredoxin subunit